VLMRAAPDLTIRNRQRNWQMSQEPDDEKCN
jgi:hypothetical protein